jgi:exodeoxyribonuclease-3
MLTIMSWNINGIRAVLKKGFLDFLKKYSPDILCLQEVKAHPEQLEEEIFAEYGYSVYWNPAEKKGYSGVVTLLKKLEPINVEDGIGKKDFGGEGRVMTMQFKKFTLVNAYFPHGRRDQSRIPFKMEFSNQFIKYVNKLKKENPLVLGGDFNVAHKEVDIARPKQNLNNSGFLPIERAWADKLISNGFVDTFRMFNQESGNYTWWSQRAKVRDKNIGWRIDYFFVTQNLAKRVKEAFILPQVKGSDHCPIGMKISI